MDNSSHSEQDLARAAQAGSSEAYSVLVKNHYPAIHAFLITLLGSRTDAEDLTQETFIHAHSKIRHFNPTRPFRPWIFTIARRLAITHWRRQRPTVPLDESTPHPEAPTSSTTSDAVQLWEAIRQTLKPEEFSALWFFYRENLTIKELAKVLGKTQSHTKVILHRARTRLRDHLDPETWSPASHDRRNPIQTIA
jgi:RNA polymerase sigma-70 factor (ECF subfamily)